MLCGGKFSMKIFTDLWMNSTLTILQCIAHVLVTDGRVTRFTGFTHLMVAERSKNEKVRNNARERGDNDWVLN